ncbi:MAG TPA: MFS transporter, partial [Anaerolineales bacterium]|nr:MFS transporter [Anaerolineales bacterium]
MFTRFFSKTYLYPILHSVISVTLVFLLIEFFDELNFGIEGAALPVIRDDFGLTYTQIGLLFGAPHLISTLIEPVLMLLGDTRLRKSLIIAGGLMITLALLLIAFGHSFPILLIAMLIAFPASGAFVSLSQATLMDLNPGRQAQLMARWTAAGSIGNLLGPLILAGSLSLGWGWRWTFVALAGLAVVLVFSMLPQRLPHPASDLPTTSLLETFKYLGAGLWSAIRNRQLLRWLAFLEMSDLMMDRFISFVPLYFTDVIKVSPAQASLLLTGIMVTSLAADLIVIPLLEKIPGLRLVRASAFVCAGMYAAALLAPWLWVKMILFMLVSFTTLGWYPVLQGEAYAAVPGRSGTVMAVNSLAG